MRMIVLSTEYWNARRQARKELLYKALLKNNGIDSLLYVEPMDLWWRRPVTVKREQAFDPRLTVVRWRCPIPGERMPQVAMLNRRWQAGRIYKKLKQGKPYTGIFYHPSNWLTARHLRQSARWYFDWTEDWGVYHQSPYIAHLQNRAIREASGVIAVCESLYERACAIRGGAHHVRLLPNATALQAGSKPHYDEPLGIRDIPRPRIGLMGHIGPWMNTELIIALAAAQPEWQWCILGDARGDDRRGLEALANVHLLGIYPYEQLPAFMDHMEVLVAPYKPRIECDSSKLYDYLTSGKPIVSTVLDTTKRLSGLVLTAAPVAQAWSDRIEEALRDKDEALSARRRGKAAACSWDARARELAAWLCGQ